MTNLPSWCSPPDFTVPEVASYLKAIGWREIEPTLRAIVFEGPLADNGRPLRLLLPRNDDFVDVKDRLLDALQSIALLQDQDLPSIFRAVRLVDRDTLFERVATTQRDSISLKIAACVIQSLKRLVATAASAELRPTPFFWRESQAGRELASAAQFGHTFKGSFGFAVELLIPPKPPEHQQTELIPPLVSASK